MGKVLLLLDILLLSRGFCTEGKGREFATLSRLFRKEEAFPSICAFMVY